MKRLFSGLFRPWVLSLLGVVLLSLIIWFEAPLLSFNGKAPFESERIRLYWIFLFFLIYAGYFIWKFAAAKLANVQLLKGVGGVGALKSAGNASAVEIDALGNRLREATQILRNAKLGNQGGRNYMYQLPWYMFVGAPGTGKTTTLAQSGLKFPLAETMGKNAIGGVGGTRNCDWWFTDEAVLLDTAGRYTTQDSHTEVDKAAWVGFLKLLKKHRRRRPVNGIIIALSVSDLLLQSDEEQRKQAHSIRERLRELHEQLGVRFPIYVMVTKCDLLAGFGEFFEYLGRDERAQVWGVSFALDDAKQVDRALSAFPSEFELLEKQLQVRVLDRVQSERDPQRRALIYTFPQQFAGIGDVLNRFLIEVFQTSRYEEKAFLRGVYFTSGTQEGSPIDRVMGAMAAAFGLDKQMLPANATGGRSYFITRLLREVIFPEANLAGVNLQLERKRRWLQWGATAVIGLVLVLGSVGLITSYVRNKGLIEDVSQKVALINQAAAMTSAQSSPLQILPLLDAVRDLPAGYADKDQDVPLLMRLGLYQGDKLGYGAQAAYRKMLSATLLPPILKRLEEQLATGGVNSPEYLYEVLRVYLMLGDPEHFDAESVAAWVDLDWERSLGDATSAQRQALSGHVLALLSDYGVVGASPLLDKQLIATTRLSLARMPIPQRIYNRVKRQLDRARLPEFSAVVAGGRGAGEVLVKRSGGPLVRGVPGAFSLAGYRQFLEQSDKAVAEISKDSWVLGQLDNVTDSATNEQIQEAVRRVYLNEYISAWDAYLADVSAAPLGGFDQGARIAGILSATDSPLRNFLNAAAKETSLDSIKTSGIGGSAVADAVKGKFESVKRNLATAMGVDAELASPSVGKLRNPVDIHFDELHKLVGMGPDGMPLAGPAPLDSILAMLKEATLYLDAAATAKRTGTPPPPADALNKLRLEAAGKPAPLAGMLQAISGGGAGLTLGGERDRLNALWGASGAPFCSQAIADRYPLNRNATGEVSLDDFAKFFAAGGIVDEFFQKNLLPHVDMGGKQWRWRTNASNASLGISQDVLNQFQRAAHLRDAFFGGGGKQVSLQFDVKPISADAGLVIAMLEIEGQKVPYIANVAPTTVSVQLPGAKGGHVRLEASPPSAHSKLRTEGSWAWFRMLDKGVLTPTSQGERFVLTFNLDGNKLAYELSATSVVNPFQREALDKFRCMDKL